MFGCEAKIGITSSSLPTEVIATLQSEDDLVTAVTGSTSDNPVTHTTQDLTSQNSIPSTSSAVLDVPAHENTTTPQDNTTVQNHVPPINSAVPIVSSQVLADRTSRIQKRRATPYSGQVAQAERVVKRTRVDLNAGVADDNVAVPIPLVDRGRGDPRLEHTWRHCKSKPGHGHNCCKGWNSEWLLFLESIRPLSATTLNT